MEPDTDQPHLPGPSLWPVGFAVGIATLLVGLIVSWTIAAIGAAITVIFAYLWIRDLAAPAPTQSVETIAQPALPAQRGGPAMPPGDRFPRSKFLEGATLGLGGVIGGLVTVPLIGFAVVPSFIGQGTEDIDLGELSNYPEGQYVVATFLSDPPKGEVSRRTAFVRNNGLLEGEPSFTIVSNRCAHLGCPVQPNGPLFLEQSKQAKTNSGEVTLTPTQPAGFGCPCHGGQYDTEGNRTAGPPVRALDRYAFSIKNGRLFLGSEFSVGHVDGKGSTARIKKYRYAGPGEHVDGPESWLYPLNPAH